MDRADDTSGLSWTFVFVPLRVCPFVVRTSGPRGVRTGASSSSHVSLTGVDTGASSSSHVSLTGVPASVSSRRVTGVHASPSVLTSSGVLDDSRAGVCIGDVCTAVRAPRLTAPMPAFSGESGALILSIMSSSLRCLSNSACLLRCSNGDTDLRCGAGGDAVGSVLGAVKPSVKLRRRPLAPGICPAF